MDDEDKRPPEAGAGDNWFNFILGALLAAAAVAAWLYKKAQPAPKRPRQKK